MISAAVSLVFVILFALLGIAAFVFWIWMLVDTIQNRGLSASEKIAWVLVILFLHFLGGLIYFVVGRPKGKWA